jgi:hypothetical protein
MSAGMTLRECFDLITYIANNNSPERSPYPRPCIKYVDPHVDMRTNTVFAVSLRGYGDTKDFYITNEFISEPKSLEQRIREYLDTPQT